ncbi:MAG: hypothetical protein PHR43_04890 [Dehalococcoidales bacterium]|nr:hypothetical protein [Dehalococcoidales bacterium]
MKFLKGLVLSILNFLLFLSLSVFGLAFAFNGTLLRADFVAGEIEKLDVAGVVKDVFDRQVQLPAEFQSAKPELYAIISAEEPWLKQQAKTAIADGYDYFLGKSAQLRISVPLDDFKNRLSDKMKTVAKPVFMQSLPPQLAGATPAQIDQYFEQYFNNFWQQFASQIPAQLEVNESTVSPADRQQIAQVRQWLAWYQLGYKLLIALMVVLILLVVFIHREIKGAARDLGITFLSYGAFEYGGILLMQYFMPSFLSAPSGIPEALWTWINGLINDVIAPLANFSLGCLVGGAVLLIVSFVVKSRTAEEPPPIN